MKASILGLALALSGCTAANVGADTANAVACSLALLEAGTTDAGTLTSLALRTPACAALASDIIGTVIVQVQTKLARRAP